MALVSYDYESSSDIEEESTSSGVITVNTTNGTEKSEEIPEILSHLPKTKEPKSTIKNVLDDELEDFIPKYQPPPIAKKPPKVKITIPALSEFDDDEEEEEPEQKKSKQSIKGSSLLSILPPAKGSPLSTKSFIPRVLKKKPIAKSAETKSLVPHAVRKKAEAAKKIAIRKMQRDGSDVETDDEEFEVPETFDEEMWLKVCGPKFKPKPQAIEENVVDSNSVLPDLNIAPEPEKPYDGLDNAAFKELVGKAKRPVNIKLVDINEEEILADQEAWVTKAITDPEQAPKPVVEDPCDPTRRKKHHITYLAEQAKANEQELQTSWSSSKFARNQTRAKYGF